MSESPIRTSAETDKLDAAMAAAQAELENPIKGKTANLEGVSKSSGKEYKIGYAYADIADILAVCRPILGSHGIALYQPTVITDNGSLMIVTRLAHAGQWMESDYPVCKIGGDHQDMGKALTYGRRYALGAMIGIAPEKDTDGAGAAAAHSPTEGTTRTVSKSDDSVLQAFIASMKMNKTREKVDAWANREANAIGEQLNKRDQERMQDAFEAYRIECDKAAAAQADSSKTTTATKSLADRAAIFESAMKDCKDQAALRRTYETGQRLRDDLDKSDPERLAELNSLYEDLFTKMDRKVTEECPV